MRDIRVGWQSGAICLWLCRTAMQFARWPVAVLTAMTFAGVAAAQAPVVTVLTPSHSVCASTFQHQLVVSATNAIGYQWTFNNVDIGFGGTSPSYYVGSPLVSAGDAGTYRCRVTGPGGTSTLSSPIVLTVGCPGTRLYVNAAQETGVRNGSSWASAFTSLNDAVIAARHNTNIVEIWVASGTYPLAQFGADGGGYFVENKSILGSFAGFEASPSERPPGPPTTTIVGTSPGAPVLELSGTASNLVLDGLTISGGRINDTTMIAVTGGLSLTTSARVVNCVFSNNLGHDGGGVRVVGASPTFENCVFADNVAGNGISEIPGAATPGWRGGGVFLQNSSSTFTLCTFLRNRSGNGVSSSSGSGVTSAAGNGGAVFATGTGTPSFINCLFDGNTTGSGGSGIASGGGTGGSGAAIATSSSTNIRSCTFANNSTGNGGSSNFGTPGSRGRGAVYLAAGAHTIANSIFWGNQALASPGVQSQQLFREAAASGSPQNCCIEGLDGTLGGSNNFGGDPRFVGQGVGDFRLTSSSSCIGQGSNALVPATLLSDLAGHSRIIYGVVDSGAYEFVGTTPTDNCRDAPTIPAGTYTFSTLGSTTDGPNEPGPCDFFGYTQVDSDVWFRYQPGCTGSATIALCGSSFDTKMVIYRSSACPTLPATASACSEDSCAFQSTITLPVTSREPLLIRIGGYQGQTGTALLSISCTSPPTCSADFNGDGALDPDDLADYIGAYFAQPPGTGSDFNGDGAVDPDDLADFIGAYFAGC